MPKSHPLQAALLLLGPALAAGPALAQQGRHQGEQLFGQVCAQCHSLQQGENRLGPNLHAIIGRESGGLEDFNYSSAMEQSDIVWSADSIARFIEHPDQVVPGTKMAFTGLPNQADRQAVVAYLQQAAGSSASAGDSGTGPSGGGSAGGADQAQGGGTDGAGPRSTAGQGSSMMVDGSVSAPRSRAARDAREPAGTARAPVREGRNPSH